MSKRKFVIASVILGISLLLAVVYFYQSSSTQQGHPSSTRIQEALRNKKIAQYFEDLVPPETASSENTLSFIIDSYELGAQLPSIPQNPRIYALKTRFTHAEINQLATKLLGPNVSTEYLSDKNFVSLNSKHGTLTLNTTTGAFSFYSLLTKLPFQTTQDQPDIRPQLTQYLKNSLGVIDDTITATAYYTRSTNSNITYYEFHRDWDKVGLAIINPVGVINLPTSKSVSQLSLTGFDEFSPDDTTITFASDVPGKKRNDDFNTMTVAVSQEGYVVSIDSNIRLITEERTLADAGLTLLDPNKVIDEIKHDGSYFNIALPSGEGFISLEKTFPNHELKAKVAEITDVSLVFTEKHGDVTQKYLYPSYIVRGVAETETGVRTKFAQTVPAINDISKLSQTSLLEKVISYFGKFSVKQVYAQSDSQKCFTEIIYPCGEGEDSVQCTFTLKRCITPTTTVPTVTVPTATPYITPPQEPSSTPVPDLPGPCVLYRLNEEDEYDIVELANEFAIDAPDLNSPINPFGWRYDIPGIGVIAYFPVSLPDGPIAVRISRSTNARPGTPLAGGEVLYGRQFDSLQIQVELEVAIRAAQRIQQDPSLLRYIDHPRYQVEMIDLNHIFPEVGYDMLDNRIMNSFGIHWNIQQAVEEYNGWTLEQLANTTQELAEVPTRMLIGARRATYGDNPIGRDANQFVLDARCKFLSPVSPLLYFYPEQPLRITLSFLHPYVVYGEPILNKNLVFNAYPSGKLLFDGIERDKYHYEYSSVKFDKPQQGWIIPSENVFSYLQYNLAPKLGLQDNELTDLIQDVRGSLAGKNQKPYMFIGLIPEKQLGEKLPFEINPKPQNISRKHLYISFMDTKNYVEAPKVTSIHRNGFDVVELGVYVE